MTRPASRLMEEDLAKAEKLDPVDRLMYLAVLGVLLCAAVKPPKEKHERLS